MIPRFPASLSVHMSKQGEVKAVHTLDLKVQCALPQWVLQWKTVMDADRVFSLTL